MTKSTTIDSDTLDLVQLMSRHAVEEQYGEAVASIITADKIVAWAKFILTDDRPNKNKQRIPIEEFDNIIRSGIFMPVKMAIGKINDTHDDAKPIGVITHLRKIGSHVEALAALWSEERPEDVSFIKNEVEEGRDVNVSWEVLYGDSRVTDGISDLLETVLRAVTIVGMPAYAGRTPILAVASTKKWSKAYIEDLPDTNFLYVDSEGDRHFAYKDDSGKLDSSRFPALLDEISASSLPQNTQKNIRQQLKKLGELAQSSTRDDDIDTEEQKLDKELEAKVSELETKLAKANEALVEKTEEVSKVTGEKNEVTKTLETLQSEVEPLREFKAKADEALEKEAKLKAVKAKFEEAGVEKPEEYFAENEEHLLGLDDASLEFMLQEMVAFKKEDEVDGAEASVRNTKVPNLNGRTDPKLDDIKTLAQALRDRNKK